MDTNLHLISLKGLVDIDERGPMIDGARAKIADVLHGTSDTVSLYVSTNDLDDRSEAVPDGTVFIELNAVHVVNEDDDRIFNSNLEAFIQRRDLELLHAYLGFLLGLKHRKAEDVS